MEISSVTENEEVWNKKLKKTWERFTKLWNRKIEKMYKRKAEKEWEKLIKCKRNIECNRELRSVRHLVKENMRKIYKTVK